MGVIKGAINGAQKFINAIKNTINKIIKAVKFFASPIGTVVGWILLIIVIVILVNAIIEAATIFLTELTGQNWNYDTFDEDLAVVQDLYQTGYEAIIDAENFQNFKSFEYSVLMDAAEYIRHSKQNMFDIYENEGEYVFEREEIYQNRLREKYDLVMESLIGEESGEYNNTSSAAVTLLNVGYGVSLDGLTDEELDSLVAAGADSNTRNIKVEAGFSSVNKNGSIKGGNNRVMGPYLVYEFKAGGYGENTSGESKEETSSTTEPTTTEPTTTEPTTTEPTTTIPSNTEEEENGDPKGTVNQLLSSGDMRGSLEPFIYVVREDIEFSYYFDSNNNVIEIPLILNAFNSTLTLGVETSKEVNRMTLGLPPVVFPDIDSDKYTMVPYYSDEMTPVIYKIPLRTLLGRYMPKAELLQAWAILKQEVDVTEEDKEDIMDDVINSIKGVYAEACLINEEITKTEEATNESGEKRYYTNDESHQTSFVTFEKAGIENTKYDINGFSPLEESGDSEENIKIVTDIVNAVIMPEEFEISYEITLKGEKKESGTKTISTAEIASSIGVKKGTYIAAAGTPEEGYSPPSSLDGEEGYYSVGGSEDTASDMNATIVTKLETEILEKFVADNAGTLFENTATTEDSIVFPEEVQGNTDAPNTPTDVKVKVELSGDVAMYNPIFTTEEAKVAKKLKIEHSRMPVLLVKTATTWCRKITYNHNITQNPFKQNNAKYIIPKSVSAMGLEGFTTTLADSSGYRGKAYKEVFARMKEKDVINMLLQFETSGREGSSDAYEYMRDLYKLLQVSKEYSQSNLTGNINTDIHENTYNYIYVPDSVLYYDDNQTQKIYWLDLFAAYPQGDAITEEEIENVRTKDRDITWQVVEYEKYPECNNKVYALSPFGSAYVRAYYQLSYKKGQSEYLGSFEAGKHNGADWGGRERINRIIEGGKSSGSESFEEISQIGGAIYSYEYSRLSEAYGTEKAEQKLEEELESELINLPIVAVAPGEVTAVSYSAREGFYVKILHTAEGESVETLYMHLKRWPLVNVGDYVGAGTYLGYEGCTGRSFGKHLHFQVEENDVVQTPSDYIFPTFNPFYNQELAAGEGYDLTSEYMSLYRTVSLVGSNSNGVGAENLENQVPSKALVNDYNNLIQNQGTIKREISMSGTYGWNDSGQASAKAYINYLRDENIYDIYNEPAFFDKALALQEGYLAISEELYTLMFGYIAVHTEMPASLPALTREELVYILENWLPSRYADEELEFLQTKVFTEEMIDTMLEMQEKYKISPVFMMAVATQECQMGVSSLRDPEAYLSNTENCNIYSIKYPSKRESINIGSVSYIGDTWCKYEDYAMATEDFAQLIGEGGPYFRDGNFTIAAIGAHYCEPPHGWIKGVTSIALEIMQYYIGDDWSFPEGTWFGDNSEFLGLAGECVKWLYDHGFNYSFSGGYIPYKNLNADGSFGQPRAGAIDCSTYVSWVIYEYGRIHNIPELTKFGDNASYNFQDIAERINGGSTAGYDKYFQVVWIGSSTSQGLSDVMTKEQVHALLQPGDILIYRKGVGHVDIFYDWVNPENTSSTSIYKYSCGMAPKNKSEYGKAEPYACTMHWTKNKNHGFWDITAVMRLNVGG